MEVDNSADVEDSNHSSKAKEISLEHVNVNGINGYSSEKHKSHKSEHKDKHRDKDRDKERDRDKSKDHKSSHKDKDRHSSSSKDKDRHSSHKSSSKDKDRSDRDRDKDRSDRDKDRGDREKDRSDRDKDRSDRDKDRSDRDKDRSDRDKDRSDRDKDRGDRDKSRSDRDKDRDKHRDKDRHRDDKKSSSKDKDRDHKSSRDKEHKSSSSKDKEGRDKDREKDRDKDREREKDKEKRDKDKDREKDKDRHKHSSSKDKDKDRHSSSKDKHRDKERDREKDKHSSSKDKDRKDKEKKLEKEKEEENKIKEEADADSAKEDSIDEDDQKLVIKEDPDSQDEIDYPDVSQASSCDYNLSHFSNQPKLEDEFFKEEEDSQQEDDDSQQEDDDSQQEEDDSQQEDDSQLERNSNVKEESDEEYKPDVKTEQPADDSDEDMPLAARLDKSGGSMKRKLESEDEDDIPLMARKKVKKEKKEKKKKKYEESDYEDEEEDYKPLKKKGKKEKEKEKKVKVKKEPTEEVSPEKAGRKKKKEEEEQEVWKWWEEQKRDDGTKWTFLEHKGPVFAPPYERLPSHVKFYYDGKEMELSEGAEEVAGFYAKMLDHDYTSKEAFNKNFFDDWRKMMTEKERKIITDLKKCNFKKMHAYFMDLSEKNKNRTKEEKKALKEKNEALIKEYGFCTIDGHKEKIGNFKIEPPGLFRGRGEHPKMGKLKRRVVAEDIIINCSKDSKIPEPPPGHKWKEVRHDPSVTWLASWTENVQSQVKYIMLNPSSKLKGEKDWQKYETARRLQKCIDKIRREYKEDWKSKEMRIRQRAVALYFIDRLALRAGNEKDEDQADTVGCCSLRVEHIELHEKKDDKDYVVVFDFLGKDSIRYYNEVPVEKRVFKNLQLFMENKRPGDDLFDRLTTQILNKHLNELMEGLTAKVFRTYNASWTLQQQLDELTNPDDSIAEKILSYNRANRAVAILCNHQRSVPKGHQKSMEKLKEKIEQKREQIRDAERQVKDAAKDAKRGSVKEKQIYEKKSKMLQKMKEQLTKLEIQETDRDENKTIALGTSKLNYLDPRISVAWCKKYGVPIEKIYNKTQRDKFRWAIDMAGPDYHF